MKNIKKQIAIAFIIGLAFIMGILYGYYIVLHTQTIKQVNNQYIVTFNNNEYVYSID